MPETKKKSRARSKTRRWSRVRPLAWPAVRVVDHRLGILVVGGGEGDGECPGRPGGRVRTAVLIEAHRKVADDAEAPVIGDPPFLAHGGPQGEAPFRVTR